MKTHSQEDQKTLTPQKALIYLKDGNQRFVNNLKYNRDLLAQVNETRDGQFPFASILSCSDSRTSAELVFDQGLGDIFSVRLAGNIASDYAVGSLEFACKYLGSKVIVVLGHTSCGAVKGACDFHEEGYITALLSEINGAVRLENTVEDNRTSSNVDFVNKVMDINVHFQMEKILNKSSILREMKASGQIDVVGATYDVGTGVVSFFE
jgi:carbonic anhydrase